MAVVEVLIAAAAAIAAAYVIDRVASIAVYLFNHLIFGSRQPNIEAPTHSESYTLHENDREYIRASRQLLTELLGENPTDTLHAMDAKARVEAVRTLTERLAALYGLDDIRVELAYDKESEVSGACDWKNRRIVLNCVHLLTDNRVLTEDFLDTIFHEFRHAVQWQLIEAEDPSACRWYTDADTVRRIAEGQQHYISLFENPRAYYEQFVELDAREIAMYILEGIC